MDTLRISLLLGFALIAHRALPAGPELTHGGDLDFGLMANATTRQTRYPISNTGDSLLKIDSLSIGGTNPWDFSFFLREEDRWILPGETVYGTVTASVYGSANYNASVILESNAVNSPPAIALHSSTSHSGEAYPSLTFSDPDLVKAGGNLVLSGFSFGEDLSNIFAQWHDGSHFAEVEPMSVSDSQMLVQTPSYWPTWESEVELFVRVSRDGNQSNELSLLLTEHPPMQPLVTSLDNLSGSPGDVLRIWGNGFSQEASRNLVFFGGNSQIASNWTDNGGDHGGLLEVVIPQGTGSEVLTVRRTDGQPGTSAEVAFQRRAPAVMTLSAGDEQNGFRIPGPGGDAYDSWVLDGSGFEQFRLRPYSGFEPGILELEVTGPDGVWPALLRSVMTDDGRLMVHPDTLWPHDLPPDHSMGITALRDGDTVSVRARGYELDNTYVRWSEPITLTAREITAGAQTDVTLSRGESITRYIAPDVWLNISGLGNYTAPGLWDGSRYFNSEWFDESPKPRASHGLPWLQVPGPSAGSITLRNEDTNTTTELIVDPAGVPGALTATFPEAVAKGVKMHCGGAWLTIPAGALPYYDGTEQSYTITMMHQEVDESTQLFDSAETAFGKRFHISFDPEPDVLHKAIEVIIPYDPDDFTDIPEFGIRDPESLVFKRFAMESNASNGRFILNVPAGNYGAPATDEDGIRQLSFIPDGVSEWFSDKKASLNVAWQYVAPVSWMNTMGQKKNEEKGIYLNYVSGAGSAHTISDTYASSAFSTAETTFDYLVGAGWEQPTGLNLHFRTIGEDIDGSTTKGVFGNPWVFISTGLDANKLKTTVSHEIGHAFQREYTTNLVTYWIDEATANWIAWRMHGMTDDLKIVFEAGADFPKVSFPSSRDSGFSQEQFYAAAIFFIWLSHTYTDAPIQQIYEKLYLTPTYWFDMHALLTEVTSSGSFKSLVQQFGDDYWSRSFSPVDAMNLPYNANGVFGAGDVTREISVPSFASKPYRFFHKAASQPEHEGARIVLRASGIQADQHVTFYAANNTTTEVTWTRLGRLTHNDEFGIDGGTYGAPYKAWLAVVNNYSEEDCQVSLSWCFPEIVSLSSNTFPKDGGYNLGVRGNSFGEKQGKVFVGGYEVEISYWSETYISTLTPAFASGNMSVPVIVEMAEGFEIDNGFSVWITE